MILKRSKEDIEFEAELEERKILLAQKDKQRQRDFELEKVRLETSVPQRWKAIDGFLTNLIMLPVYLLCLVFCFILELFQREVPQYMKDILKEG